MKEIFFVTSNYHKFREIMDIFMNYLKGVELKITKIKKIEIQSDNLEKIVRFATEWILENTNFRKPFFVEDAGLFINALKGFPGPYSHYVYKTIGINGILKLMNNVTDRSALFQSIIAFWDGNKITTFKGQINGNISLEPRGTFGFGFDPIFIPQNATKTFAEMTIQEKNLHSHRAKSAKKLVKYIAKNLFSLESTDPTS